MEQYLFEHTVAEIEWLDKNSLDGMVRSTDGEDKSSYWWWAPVASVYRSDSNEWNTRKHRDVVLFYTEGNLPIGAGRRIDDDESGKWRTLQSSRIYSTNGCIPSVHRTRWKRSYGNHFLENAGRHAFYLSKRRLTLEWMDLSGTSGPENRARGNSFVDGLHRNIHSQQRLGATLIDKVELGFSTSTRATFGCYLMCAAVHHDWLFNYTWVDAGQRLCWCRMLKNAIIQLLRWLTQSCSFDDRLYAWWFIAQEGANVAIWLWAAI